jgi:hypothetical protein
MEVRFCDLQSHDQHVNTVADSEAKPQWFAFAFHLRQLLAAEEPEADQLQQRLWHCEGKLKQA